MVSRLVTKLLQRPLYGSPWMKTEHQTLYSLDLALQSPWENSSPKQSLLVPEQICV